jgi:Spy/CpxP family protein refolding chaperone
MEKGWKVVLAFVGVFIAGAVFGGFFSLGVGKELLALQPPAPAAKQAQPPRSLAAVPPSWQAPQLLGRFTERLNLTAEQREKIKPLVQRASEDYRRQWQNNVRETGFILQRLQNDIRKELTPEQQARLEKMEQHQKDIQKDLQKGPARFGERGRKGGPEAGFEPRGPGAANPPSNRPPAPDAEPGAPKDENKE